MVAMSAKGPLVSCNVKVMLLACKKVMEFVTDAKFSKLAIEGDNGNVMEAISSSIADLSLLRNVVGSFASWFALG